MGPGRDEAMRATRTARPVHLDLRRIAQPVGAWTSILHRISGVGLNDYDYLLYWCKPFSVKVGDGEME